VDSIGDDDSGEPNAYAYLARVRNRRELHASLKGATLGDADGDVDSTLKWIKRSKKKEKELAKKRQEELEQMDKVFLAEYTERASGSRKIEPFV
jgi:U4/U6.U5 tri-snRNP-associated protein 1